MEIDAKKQVNKLLETIRQYKTVLIVLLVGVVLLLLPTGSRETGSEAPAEAVNTQEEDLEARLEEILSLIDGAGQVRVLLTRVSDGERILATDVDTTERGEEMSREESTVIVSQGSGVNDAVEVKYLYPEFRGAVVVAEGAGSASVELAITQAVSAATGLGSDSIKVIKMK